jgi:hypothetical protein
MHRPGKLGGACILRQLTALRAQLPVIAGLGLVVEFRCRQKDDSLRRGLFDALGVEPKQRMTIIVGFDQIGVGSDVAGLGVWAVLRNGSLRKTSLSVPAMEAATTARA